MDDTSGEERVKVAPNMWAGGEEGQQKEEQQHHVQTAGGRNNKWREWQEEKQQKEHKQQPQHKEEQQEEEQQDEQQPEHEERAKHEEHGRAKKQERAPMARVTDSKYSRNSKCGEESRHALQERVSEDSGTPVSREGKKDNAPKQGMI